MEYEDLAAPCPVATPPAGSANAKTRSPLRDGGPAIDSELVRFVEAFARFTAVRDLRISRQEDPA